MNRTSKRILGIGMPLAAVAATGVAFATWSANGTGSGYSKAYGITAVATQQPSGGDAPTAQLYPGGTGDVVVDVTNSNAYAVNVSSIVLTGATVSGTDQSGCTAADFTVNTGTSWTGTVSVAGSGHHAFTVTGGLTMKSTAATQCQNALVTLALGSNAITAGVGS